ncbi:acyl-CoA dehydrogenase family protein [Roseateles subflavus]|nr:acyl-CoA dehydrogenase [Pelomonas sp. APW6]
MMMQWSAHQLALRERFAALGAALTPAHDPLAEHATASVHGAGSAVEGSDPNASASDFDAVRWQRLRESGLWELIAHADVEQTARPEAWWNFTAALEGLASTLRAPALLLSIIAQAGMVRALQRHGSPEQQRTYLAALRRGDLCATGIAEPNTGTDVRSIRSTLSACEGGYRLNGSKYNIAHAPMADFSLIVCRHDDAEGGVALVFVDQGAPGLSAGPPDRKLGNTALPTGSLAFRDVFIPHAQVLGAPRRGLRQLVDIISLGRAYYGLVAAHLVSPFLDDAMRYAESRHSFQEAIVEHQYVQRRLTDIRIGMERSRWTALGALGRLLNEEADALLACSVAKLVGSEDLIRSAQDLVRLYGSRGYHEGPVATLMRDALGFASVGGTEEMHRKNIFNQMSRPGAAPSSTATPRGAGPARREVTDDALGGIRHGAIPA